jgi:hypothetical protein
VHVERAQRRHDDEVRENEGPAARPRAPEAAAQIRKPYTDLDGERTRERLADGDAFSHLVLGDPALAADQLALHLAHQGNRTAEAEETQAEVVPDEVFDGNAPRGRLLRHDALLLRG